MALTKVSPDVLDLDSGITISTADNTTQLTLTSTDADSSAGPVMEFYRNSSSPADNDGTGLIYFTGENDADEKVFYGQIYSQILDASDASEDSSITFYTMAGGTSTANLSLVSGKVGINTSAPSVKFEVQEAVASTYTSRFMHTGNPNSGPPQILKLEFYNTPNNGTSEFLKCRDTLSGTAVNRAVIMSNGGIGNYTTNDFNYSDERMKKDISNATAQLDNLKKLQLKTFRYKEQEASEPTNLGVVAQDIQTDFPALVTEQGEGDEARLGVKEQQIMWMAVKAIQELSAKVEELESKINE
tara:strand:- start:56 stop:955 length:900 start_codon:yes stop_codon:yes gene_type:complete